MLGLMRSPSTSRLVAFVSLVFGSGCEKDLAPGPPAGSTGGDGAVGDSSAPDGSDQHVGDGSARDGSDEPIEAAPDTWVWVPLEGSECGNGTPAGIAVNLHEGSTKLVVIVSGGGACWSGDLCNGASPTSIHLHDTLTYDLVAPELPAADRSDPASPLASASFAYVPYCTGDFHWGDRVADYPNGPIHHRGGSNMRTFLARLSATRPATDEVYLIGGSAGGYGVTLTWGAAKQAFGAAPVHVLADSSPFILPRGTRWAEMVAAWGPLFPDGCSACASDPAAIVDTLAMRYPTSRHGLLGYDQDQVIAWYFGFDADLLPAIDALLVGHYDTHENTKYFVAPGSSHIMLGAAITASDGTTVNDFVAGWMRGSPSWKSERVR
jgi:hypothetical protein